jgi:hypothetical protein
VKVRINDWDEKDYAIQIWSNERFGAILLVPKSKDTIYTNKEIKKGVDTEVDKIEITDEKVYIWL